MKDRGDETMRKMPELRLRYKLILYFLTPVFCALAIIGAAFECFPDIVEFVCYILAALTLAAAVFYFVRDLRHNLKGRVMAGIEKNLLTKRLANDYRLRTILFSLPSTASSVLFAVFNAFLGWMNRSAWFGTLAGYYIVLSVMRVGAALSAAQIARIDDEDKRRRVEERIYCRNSAMFFFLAVALAGMVILLETGGKGKRYSGYMIYAAAAYTFYKITIAAINVAKVRKHASPLLTIIRKISYIDACVSVLTLQTAMFASFAGDTEEAFANLMNAVTGGAVCVMIFALGIQGLYTARRSERQ